MKKPDVLKKRPRGRPFEKGHKRHPRAGRRAGTPNKVTREVKEFLLDFVKTDAYQKSLKKRLLAGKATTVEVLALHWAGGKPKETHEVSAGTLDHLYAIAAAKGLGERASSVDEEEARADA